MSALRICEICKQPIEPERAEALPETRLCTEHAQAIRQYGGEFKVSIEQEVTSKVGSLKRNYGGVSAKTKRNHEAMRKLKEAYGE